MGECEKGCQQAWPTVNINTPIFKFQYLCYYFMDIYATNTSRRDVKRSF